MDAELRELQALFEQAQEAKAELRLSERNVVELVLKLQELQLLESDLLHTVSGKEYITQEQLRREVEAEVQRLGRISLVDLAATLGVELIHCERQAQLIVESNPDLNLVQGEILASSYWDSVAEEINETLQEAGQVPVAELARRFAVGAELLTGVLSSRLGTSIHGRLEGGQLYTPTFIARIGSTVRGAARALMVPTPVSTLWTSLQQQMREGEEGTVGGVTDDGGLFRTVLNQLIADGEVKGSLHAGNAVYTPAVFAVAQRGSVESFFSQNGYITYEALRKLAVPQPKQYLQAKYADGIALETVFVHPSLVSQLDAAAEDAIGGNNWFDALPLVPPSIGSSDAAKLVPFCPSVQRAIKSIGAWKHFRLHPDEVDIIVLFDDIHKDGEAAIFAETCVVSNTFIKDLVEKFESQARELIEKKVAEKKLKPASQKAFEDDPSRNLDAGTVGVADGDAGQTKNKGRRKGNQGGQVNKSIADAEVMSGKGGKGKRRASKGKGGGALVGETGTNLPKSSKASGKRENTSDDDDVYTLEYLAAEILKWFPDMESAGVEEDEDGALVRALAESVRPTVVAAGVKAKQALFSAQAEERRRRLDTLQQKIDEVYANLQLFSKALELFEDNKNTEVVLHRHLLRTTGAEIADSFLIAQAMDSELTETSSTEIPHNLSGPLSASQRFSLANRIAERELSTKAVALVESLEGKSVDAFESELEAAVNQSGLRLKKLDKKTERALLFSYRKGLASQVEEEIDSVALLPKVVGLLFVQVHGRALQAPGRAMLAAVIRLKGSVSDEIFDTLMEYHSSTVQLLSSQSVPDLEENSSASKREELESSMPKLKSFVLSSSAPSSVSNEKQ